jgi:phosphoglucosamine mutase
MLREGYSLGGEQSGHMIFLEHSTTGDGQLTALQFLRMLCRSGQKASALAARIPRYPQILVTFRRGGRQNSGDGGCGTARRDKRAKQSLEAAGRILVGRPARSHSSGSWWRRKAGNCRKLCLRFSRFDKKHVIWSYP